MRWIVPLVTAVALGAQALATQAASAEPYLQASSKKARCAALSLWYTKTLEVAGPNAFSPDVYVDELQKTTARGFVDDVFVPAIGAPYNDLTARQRKSIHSDIGSCSMAPAADAMRDYMQSAFSDDTRFSMVRGWQATIPLAQRRAADAASFRNGQAATPAAPTSVARGFVSYAQATSKDQRCTALQKWYERGVALTGKETFGKVGVYSGDVMRNFARAFQDDTFPTFFGMKYRDVQPAQMPQMKDDILTCDTPAVGKWARMVASAFIWGRDGRDAWLKPIETQAAQLEQMRYASIPDRAPIVAARPASGKAVGPYDAKNRRYSRIIYSDDRVNVGARDLVSGKCLNGIEYTVGIDLARNEPITPAIAKDVIDKVLTPLAARECPGANLTIFASFFTRTLAVTHKGEVVPAGSVEITGETELAAVSYGPGHRKENAPPTMYYGGINLNYPELASLDGIVGYSQRGGRDPVQVAASTPQVETRYVNYKPSTPRGAIAALHHGTLIQQLADHDFFGIYLDPNNYPSPDSSGTPQDGFVNLLAMFTSLGRLDPLGLDLTPARRGLPYAIEAFSAACRASLGPNPATYTPTWQEQVGETVQPGLYTTVITRYWKTMIGKTVYMDPAYRDLYAQSVAKEKSIIMREILVLRDQLGLEQLLGGQATIRPLLVIKEYQDDAATFVSANGCESGKKLLRNWVEFVSGAKPPVRPNGDYPMVVEHHPANEEREAEVAVAIGDVPASEAPFYPYMDGTWLYVNYYGDRKGGLQGYYASHFNLAFLPGRMQRTLMSGEHDALLQTFQRDRIRILNCFYSEGTANYWLEGSPQPNEQQRALVGTAFRGSAPRCPARWPG